MSIKIAHTSDWHLGKKLYKVDRIPDQRYFLKWLLRLVKNMDLDVLLVSGDIFDVPSPPHDAIELFYEYIKKFVSETKCKLYFISGNHDSPTLIQAPNYLVDQSRVKFVSSIDIRPEIITDNEGHQTAIHFLPYFKANDLYRWFLNGQKRLPHNWDSWPADEQLLFILEKYAQSLEPNLEQTNILMGHHLFGEYFSSGSEQTVYLSGIDSIPLRFFERFDYLALGHIHKPQKIRSEKPLAIYPGSPIPIRFSEKEVRKISILGVSKDHFTQDWIEIPSFRDLISSKILIDQYKVQCKELIGKVKQSKSPLDPLVEVKIILNKPDSMAVEKIKTYLHENEVYPILVTTQISQKVDEESEIEEDSPKDLRQLPSPLELFKKFYAEKFQLQASQEVLEDFQYYLKDYQKNED